MESQLPPNERPAAAPRSSAALLVGALLVLAGVIFLLDMLGIARVVLPHWNWPALLLILPVFWAARSAYQAYQRNGERWNREARDKAIWAVIFLVVFGMTFYGWRWGQMWPFIPIVAGAALLLRNRAPRSPDSL